MLMAGLRGLVCSQWNIPLQHFHQGEVVVCVFVCHMHTQYSSLGEWGMNPRLGIKLWNGALLLLHARMQYPIGVSHVGLHF